ncbi:MAG: methyltransferase domain-containing protein [Chloroflexi bacterium]|nr:methyltransferase domain-containing protein [Chloroflexota bacterium]
MQTYLVDLLACPACHGELQWDIADGHDDRIEVADVRCLACAATYPVREGIGVFLTPDLPRDDLWEQVDSHLVQYLRQHPEVERRLMEVPLETLSPADQFFRALILDERGEYAAAKVAAELARTRAYTSEYLACSNSQVNHAIEHLSSSDSPIVDLASGLGHLLEEMARRLTCPIVATDFSPRVLRRDRQRLEFFGLYDRVSLLAFDARRTPFKDGAVKTLTTYQGLANIREPGNLLRELRRVVSGEFLALSIFYPEDDEANAEAINEMGLADLLFRRAALEHFAEAGWEVEVVYSCTGKARPTPTGVVLEGAGIDALPVAETRLEWCTLLAK